VNPRRSNYGIDRFDATVTEARYQQVLAHTQAIMDTSAIDSSLEAKYNERVYRDRLTRIGRFASGGRLLDIGCGDGAFIKAAMTWGFNAIGVEPNAATARQAQSGGLEVHLGTLSDLAFPPESFDVVTLFHVIEHVPSPRSELTEIRRILSRTGLLVIETPNIDTPWFKVLRSRWRQFIPDHYYFFTPDTLDRLLAEVGFKVLGNESVGKTVSVRFFLSRLSRYSSKMSTLLLNLASFLKLDRQGVSITPGDIMLVFARRSD